MLNTLAKKRICEQLDELSDDNLLGIYRTAMQWDGSFDFVDIADIYDAVEGMKTEDIVNVIVYGDVKNVFDPVRFDGYGNLETVSKWDVIDECRDKSQLSELADWLLDNHIHADLEWYDGDEIQATIGLWERTYEPEEDVCDAIASMFKGVYGKE